MQHKRNKHVVQGNTNTRDDIKKGICGTQSKPDDDQQTCRPRVGTNVVSHEIIRHGKEGRQNDRERASSLVAQVWYFDVKEGPASQAK